MKLIDPTVSIEAQNNIRAPRIASMAGLTVGLLSNGKINADVLLQETAAYFKIEHGCEVLDMAYKRNASAPAPRELMDKLTRECDLLLTATGD